MILSTCGRTSSAGRTRSSFSSWPRTGPDASDITGSTFCRRFGVPTGFVGGWVESCPVREERASRRWVSDRELVSDRLCLKRSVTSGATSASCFCSTIAVNQTISISQPRGGSFRIVNRCKEGKKKGR